MKIGILGYGLWGKRIVQAFLQMGVGLYIFDSNPNVLQSLPEPTIAYPTFTEFLATNCDGYIIATPASTHFDLIQKLVPKAKPIFVEKPLVVRPEDVTALRTLVNRDVFVMHTWKYHPGVRALVDLIKDGAVGEVQFAKSQRCNWTSPRQDIDSIWNLAPHDLTICEALFGRILPPQFAVAEIYDGRARGMTAVLGQRPYYQFEISNRYWMKLREIRVHGLDGIAILRDENTDHLELFLGNDRITSEQTVVEKIPFDHSRTALESELKSFIHYLRGGVPPPTDLAEGLRICSTVIQLRSLAGIN